MKKIYFVILASILSGTINAQIITFPDVNFKNYLLSANSSNQIAKDVNGNYVTIDTNANNEIEEIEALAIFDLRISEDSISNITGLSFFSNLGSFELSETNLITELDVTFLPQLEEFVCTSNGALTSINLEGLTNLESLVISFNPFFSEVNTTGLTSLKNFEALGNFAYTEQNFNHLLALEYLACDSLTSLSIDGLPFLRDLYGNNSQENLDTFITVSVSNMPNLERIYIERCGLSSLLLNNLPKLFVLWIPYNQLPTIDLSGLNLIGYLGPQNEGSFFFGNNNLFTQLDFSTTSFLQKIVANNSQLVTLNIKDGVNDVGNWVGDIDFSNNPNLQFICFDNEDVFESEVNGIQDLITQYGYTNCVANSYCTFVPGGDYFTVNGTTTLDDTGNGCDATDLMYSGLSFSITNGTTTGTVIANETGNYSIAVQAGTHTLSPILENPTYFTLSPSTLTVNFPTQTSPIAQNFCITPNGIHNDLEVTILPLEPARPGFDAIYKVVFKNKGTTTLSGSVTFEFEDNKMDFVASVPNFSAQATGLLTYDFSNLLTFETREILLGMNINSPQETPAVNIGDQLNFTAIINPLAGDEYLLDNTSSLKQTVVGSYDPNDKTCIEGNSVGPEMIGQYVHYVIRFENTGTFPAENVVVKDMIDLTKFDLSSLIPTSSSHSFVTRIAADGKVEFIFENIQLPFDDANNDGYIAFKIKTLPSLVVGDTFSNSANIYFDYNFPIVTNTTSTTIEILGNSDFNFGDYLTIYPNPTQNSLNIKANNNISISSLNIYNSLGQLVLVTTNPSESIDVSNLKTGSYFIKVISDKGISNTQFIKQ